IANGTALFQAMLYQNQREQNVKSAPIADQARSVSAVLAPGDAYYNAGMPAPFIEDGTFVRFRELSLTYAFPARLTRLLRSRDLSLTVAVRNLALWTRYGGLDPETTNAEGYNTVSLLPVFTQSAAVSNTNVRADNFTIPLPRYLVVRLNAGF